MTKTTKYVLLGGAALVAGYVGLKWYESTKAPAASSSSGLLGGLKTLTSQIRGLSWGSTLPTSSTATTARTTQTADGGGLPWGPGTADGYAAVSDATGVRQARAYTPAQQSLLNDKQAAIAGVFS